MKNALNRMPVHPTAIIADDVHLADDVTIGPGVIIEDNVHVASGVTIGPYTIVGRHTQVGEGTLIGPHAVIGAPPQDLSYNDEPTPTIIGTKNVIREFCTIHRGTPKGRGETVVGDNNLLMAYTHVAHDCIVGSNNILSNNCTFAGHVVVGDYVTVGGLTACHQHSRIGSYAFVGGCAAVSRDVPPFFLATGNHARTTGVNRVGLQRRGFEKDDIRTIGTCFKILYLRKKLLKDAVAEIRETLGGNEYAVQLLTFIEESKRGIVRYGKPG